MESEYGIEEFLNDRSVKLECILKELYSDFIVQEILADKKVLGIASCDEVASCVKAEAEKEADMTIPAPGFLDAETIGLLDVMGPESKTLSVPCDSLSKEERTEFHSFIRNRYQGKLATETKEKSIQVHYCGVNSKNRKRKRWDPNTPNSCHFTLAKENKETSYALGVIAKFLNVQVSNFRTHGMKDRRAVTTQRVSCNRIEKERILSLNVRLRDILVYDVDYADADIRMGGHWGNRFSLILRNLPNDCESVFDERLKEIAQFGFINYFGTQRFGSLETNTSDVGRLILQRKWEEAVRLILNTQNLPHYMGTVADALKCWNETADARKALNCLKGSQSYASIEATIFRCLSKGGTWQKCITEALPMNMRSLYVHAYQSLLWNKVVSRRIREFGTSVRPDDVGSDSKQLGPNASIFDVHIPIPGITDVQNYATSWFTEMLSADDLTPLSFSSLDDRFSLNECTRTVIGLPEDVEWKFIRYSQPRQYLQDGISTHAVDTEGDLLAVQIQLSLKQGVYATVALRQITGTDMGKKNMKICSSDAKLNDSPIEDQTTD